MKKWLILLGISLGIYLLFHEIRNLLPIGVFRDSLPSVLVAPVMFSVIELTSSIKFHSHRSKLIITFLATNFIAIWFEVVVPLFYPVSVMDVNDVLGIFLGWILYITFDYLSTKLNKI